MSRSKEMFYLIAGQRRDKLIHNPILEKGNLKAASEVSRRVLERNGVSKAVIELLLPK